MKALKLCLLSVVCSLLTACQFELGGPPGSGTSVPQAPVIEQLSLNGDVLLENNGPIITQKPEGPLELSAEARAEGELSRLSIQVKRNDQNYRELAECSESPCSFDWTVTAADDGVYSFLIEAEDLRGGMTQLPYRNVLAIRIR